MRLWSRWKVAICSCPHGSIVFGSVRSEVEAVSVIVVMMASTMLEAVVDAVGSLMEARYKHTHNKRRRYW